mgnify:CR=1 FL=1
MKNLFPLIAIALAMTLTSCSASKELTAEVESAKSSLKQCEDQVATLQRELTQAKNMLGGSGDELTQTQAENQSLRSEMNNLRSQLATVTKEMQASSDNYGVWFRVQIGAYEQRRIDNSLETTDQLSLETRNELQKIALGRFRVYEDAKQLQTQLQEMGLKDAWVVSYKDGVRISVEEALRN